jgi:hypothetical protein
MARMGDRVIHNGHMADSEAVRSRRKRLHAQGDHSMCSPRRECAKPKLAAVVQMPAVGDDFDPVVQMRELAGRLVAAHTQDPANAALARELRVTLLALPSAPEGPDALDLLKLRRYDRLEDELSEPGF